MLGEDVGDNRFVVRIGVTAAIISCWAGAETVVGLIVLQHWLGRGLLFQFQWVAPAAPTDAHAITCRCLVFDSSLGSIDFSPSTTTTDWLTDCIIVGSTLFCTWPYSKEQHQQQDPVDVFALPTVLAPKKRESSEQSNETGRERGARLVALHTALVASTGTSFLSPGCADEQLSTKLSPRSIARAAPRRDTSQP